MQNHYQTNFQLKEFSLQYHVIHFQIGKWPSGVSCLKIVKHDTVVNAPKLTLGPVSQKKLESKNLSLKKMLSLENK